MVIQTCTNIKLPYEVRPINSIEHFPQDQQYLEFIKTVAQYHQIDQLSLIRRFRKYIEQANQSESKPITPDANVTQLNKLSITQQAVYDLISQDLITPKYRATVLHGVTGSGKTEVYKHLIDSALKKHKTVLMLLPEVALAMQFESIMRYNFSDQTFGLHSASTTKQKRQLWQAVLNQSPILIIGVHIPVLLPISNLGLIIVDEEHEAGYQEKKTPHLNSKEIAILRANKYQVPIVLGSATPAISTLHNLQRPNWQLAQMTTRFAGAFPTVQVIKLGQDQKQPHFLISNSLSNAIQDRLSRGEQAIIFLNRRGYCFFVQCKPCKFIFYCNNCSVSLTLHKDDSLRCHYCDYRMMLPENCPKCLISKTFLKQGIGTQQIVSVLERLFPAARIARADLDSTKQKNIWQRTVQDFQERKLDLLVGTQTITKGYHFPGVTLVGILWADLNLHLPLYNAAETTLQQIIQVAGRAGRQSSSSTVIVQTTIDHPIFNYLNEVDYLRFYQTEIQNRAKTNYPPIIRMAELELVNQDESQLELDCHAIFEILLQQQSDIAPDTLILGPVTPIVSKLNNWHIRQIYLKSPRFNQIVDLFQLIRQTSWQSQIHFIPNPLT